MEIIKTYCKLCNCKCGILVYKEKGRIQKIEGDPDNLKNKGTLCIKGRSMLEFIYDNDRTKYPMKKVNHKWIRLSWEDALNEIAERLIFFKDSLGPESVALYRGMTVYSWLLDIYFKKFMNFYGSPNTFSNAALCISSRVIAEKYTFGKGVELGSDFVNSKCILLFGSNPVVSGMHRKKMITDDILKAKKEGAKLIVVDPKRTEIASKADIYTTIRPGTDGVLILSLINVILENNLFDNDFILKHVYGFDKLRNLVKDYTPEKVEEICWVNSKIIKKIAHMFSTIKPACADKRQGVIHHENGTQTCRAIDILNAITGNIDIKGGVICLTKLIYPFNETYNELTFKSRLSTKVKSISEENLITQNFPTDIPKAIIQEKPYPIKALIVVGANPLLAWPNSQIVEKALKKLKFLVSIDVYKNETASFADIILPAATFLEKIDIQPPELGIPRIFQLQQQAIEPLGESWSEFKIIKELAIKMGFGEYFNENEEELIDSILNPWGLSVDILKQEDSGIIFEPRPTGFYRKNGFPTKTGKIELFSNELESLGFDPMPDFKGLTISPISKYDALKEYPLVLVTGNRLIATYLSFLHNLPTLHRIVPKNWIEMHPKTAQERNIRQGELVLVKTTKGSIKLEAKLNANTDPRIVIIPYGWGHYYDGSWKLANSDPGENVNILTDDNLVDKMSGMPNYKSLLCEVEKFSE